MCKQALRLKILQGGALDVCYSLISFFSHSAEKLRSIAKFGHPLESGILNNQVSLASLVFTTIYIA